MQPTAHDWQELEIALRALSADSGGGTLFIALLPPIAQVKSIQLPPVEAEDAVRLVRRGAGKYFVNAREPQVVSVNVRAGGGGGTTHALASAVPQRVMDAIRAAATGAGWKVARVVPAQSAWLSAANLIWAKSDALVDHGRIIVVDDERTEILLKREGRPESIRHLRSVGQDSERLLELVAAPAPAGSAASRNGVRPVAIIGDEAIRRKLAPVLRDRGLHPLEPEGVWSSVLNSSALSAAHFAPLTEDLELVSDQTLSNREKSRHILAAALGVVAAIVFLSGIGARYWGLRHEVATLQQQRDSIREGVAAVRLHERKIDLVTAPVAALDSLRDKATQWSVVIADIAQHLPTDAFVTQLTGKGDSLKIKGEGKDAGHVMQMLRRTPSLASVIQVGPMKSDFDDGGSRDMIDLAARIRRERAGGNE